MNQSRWLCLALALFVACPALAQDSTVPAAPVRPVAPTIPRPTSAESSTGMMGHPMEDKNFSAGLDAVRAGNCPEITERLHMLESHRSSDPQLNAYIVLLAILADGRCIPARGVPARFNDAAGLIHILFDCRRDLASLDKAQNYDKALQACVDYQSAKSGTKAPDHKP